MRFPMRYALKAGHKTLSPPDPHALPVRPIRWVERNEISDGRGIDGQHAGTALPFPPWRLHGGPLAVRRSNIRDGISIPPAQIPERRTSKLLIGSAVQALFRALIRTSADVWRARHTSQPHLGAVVCRRCAITDRSERADPARRSAESKDPIACRSRRSSRACRRARLPSGSRGRAAGGLRVRPAAAG
jgi:hypothetical protein